jgi:hypothetical protein
MDEIKDMQRTESLSRLMEQHPIRTNPFGENRAADRAYRRAERIAAGIHLLTNHISHDEPIRARVRSNAAELLHRALGLRDEMRSSHSAHVSEFLSSVRYLISLVRVLGVSGYVSHANASVVIEALDELGGFITASQRSILSENVSLTREDLTDVRATSFRVPERQSIKDASDTEGVKDIQKLKDASNASVTQSDALGTLSARVQSILEILKVGGSLGIRDISANLPEYSEKMIQRELLDLVSRGAVKKTGLKRWSRYSLPA